MAIFINSKEEANISYRPTGKKVKLSCYTPWRRLGEEEV
jgi:hypothetical protein